MKQKGPIRKLFDSIFTGDQFLIVKDIDREKKEMQLEVRNKNTDFSLVVKHGYADDAPSDEEIEELYKKSISYICRVCTQIAETH